MIPVTALSQALKADILDFYPDLGAPSQETWCPERFASSVLLHDFLRKQQETINRADTDRVALDTFKAVNLRVLGYERPALHEWEEELYGTFKRAVYDFFYPSGQPLLNGLSEAFEHADLGRGSNISAVGNDFYSKLFSSDLSATDAALYDEYRRCIASKPNWRDAEVTRIASGYKLRIVKGNKLNFVPKNDRTSRVIATEPTLNMLFQRGISGIIESRLRDYGIDLAIQQDHNRELARVGSIDGSFATIDLSSASDSFSLALLRDVLPRTQLALLERVACRQSVLPNGECVSLGMLSTMGNGYTFSFQTAIFTCMVIASFNFIGASRYRCVGVSGSKNWAVFGDDIIVPTKVARYVLRLLDICGFQTNSDKTFVEGPFRESCGSDWLLGVNVRPVYAKTWTDKASRFSLLNRLIWWQSRHHALPRLTSLLATGLGKCYVVPPSYPDSSGLRVPYPVARPYVSRDANGSFVFRSLSALPRYLTIGDAEVISPKGEPGRCYNPGGLMLSFLRGSVTEQRLRDRSIDTIGIRSKCIRYGTRSATVPNWDSFDTTGTLWQHVPEAVWVAALPSASVGEGTMSPPPRPA